MKGQALEASSSPILHATGASRDLLMAVLEVAHCLVVVLDRDGRVMMFNRFCEACTGFSASDVQGQFVWDVLIPPADRASARAVFSSLSRGDAPVSHGNPWLTRDGGRRWIQWENTILTDAAGLPEYVVATGLDVTHARATEQRATLDEAQLRAVVDNAHEGIITTDPRGLMLSVNPAAARMFGYGSDELPGRELSLLMPAAMGERPDLFLQHWVAARSNDDTGVDRELEGQRKSGEQIQLEVAISEVRVGDKQLFTSIIRDVSERRSQEEALRRRLSDAAHTGRLLELSEMTAGLAHEINQPLTAIWSFADAGRRMLSDMSDVPPSLNRALEGISGQAERATQIIRKLRSFLGKEPAERAWVDIGDVLHGALELAGHELRDGNVQVSLQLTDDLPAVLADRIQIEQVVLNLVRNSIDAMGTGSASERHLELSTRATGSGSVEVLVRDSGPGLPAEIEDRLFDTFQTTKADGMGVGLALSRSIAEAHGGSLTLDGTSVEGTAMLLTLPGTAALS